MYIHLPVITDQKERLVCRGVPTCTQIRMYVQLGAACIGVLVTVNPVLSGHSKIDKNPILMTEGRK